MRLWCRAWSAQSTFSAGMYFTANTAMSVPSTERNTPVLRPKLRGRFTPRFLIKPAVPKSTVSPWMRPPTPPSS